MGAFMLNGTNLALIRIIGVFLPLKDIPTELMQISNILRLYLLRKVSYKPTAEIKEGC